MSVEDTAQYPWGAEGAAADKAELFDVFFGGRSPDCCPCFLCGKNVGSVFVCWDGSDAKIILHPSCAQELAWHLNKDGRLASENRSIASGCGGKTEWSERVKNWSKLGKNWSETVKHWSELPKT